MLEYDEKWRKLRFQRDHLNRLRNTASREIGARMKKKDEGPTEKSLEIPKLIDQISDMKLDGYTIEQIKEIVNRIAEEIEKNDRLLIETDEQRYGALREMGNWLHESVPISNDEDNNRIERIVGDCSQVQKYSHVDLVVMIDGKLSVVLFVY